MAGAGGGALRLTYEGSASNMLQHNQRVSTISRATMEYKLDGPSSTLHMATDIQSRQLAVASRTIFKIFNIRDEGELDGPAFTETINLRTVKGSNLNYSCNDVVWSHLDPVILATAATNGAIVIWNLAGSGRASSGQKQKYIDIVLNEHRRIVNKINFHPTINKCLVSGSQDGSMRLFDLRSPDPTVTQMMFSQAESVRDVQWNPHKEHIVAAVSENGQVQLWDIRKYDRAESKWSAHPDHIYTCEWHPESRNILATAGRDKSIKVWDTSLSTNLQPAERHMIYALDVVSKIHWRPQRGQQIASISLMSDFAIHVWDLQRPYVPFASFTEHTDIPTSFLWRGEPHTLLSAGKDNRIYQHSFSDAKRPTLQGNPIGMSFNIGGDLLYSFRDGRTQEIVPSVLAPSKHPFSNIATSQSTSGSKLNLLTTSKSDLNVRSGIAQQLPTLTQKYLRAYFGRIHNAQELFRANSSYMIQIQSSVLGSNNQGITDSDEEDAIDDFLQEDDDEGHFLTNQHYVKYTAQNCRYTGMPFAALCEHNSEVAGKMGRYQLATAWQVIKSLYLADNEFVKDMMRNGSEDHIPDKNPPMDDIADLLGNEKFNDNDTRPDHLRNSTHSMMASSCKKSNTAKCAESATQAKGRNESFHDTQIDRAFSGVSGDVTSSKRQTRSGKRKSSKNKSQNGSIHESTDEEGDEEYNDTLTNIASGHMLSGSVGRGLMGGHQDGDFFGDMENALLYRFDNLNPNNFPIKSEPDFSNLPTEAFEYRRELPDESLESTQSWQRQGSAESHTNNNVRAKEDQTVLQTTVTVVNKSMNTLMVDMDIVEQINRGTDNWNPDNILLENLEYYINLNDVQTAVAMYLVVGERMNNRRLVDNPTLFHWFSSYITQLQQLKLYSEANQIMNLCHLTTINSGTTRSTFIKTCCGNCGKVIEANRTVSGTITASGRCKKCQSVANVCSLCHTPVQGLYAWCQGCGHGGHLDHMREWLENNKKCPAGCGHRCEYE